MAKLLSEVDPLPNLDLPDVTEDLRLLLDQAVFFDPWLGAITERDLDPRAEFALEEHVAAFLAQYWTIQEKARSLGALPVYGDIVHDVLRTAALATACMRGVYEGLPRVPNEDAVHRLFVELAEFADLHGVGPFVRAALSVLAYEDLLAIEYFGGVREDDFLTGRLHRPWVERPLDDELSVMLAIGTCEITLREDIRFIQITSYGRERLVEISRALQAAGFLSRRVQALYIAHFDEQGADYDHIFDKLVPSVPEKRREFLDFCQVEPGSRVLEIGSGTGLFTVESGLASRVGDAGIVYALDPSLEMTLVAKRRVREQGLRNVRFLFGRAEQVPFEDGSFDSVVGCLALHFTDARLALSEAQRLLVPGGQVSMFWSLPWDLKRVPAFAEWIAPLQRMMQHPKESGFTDRRFLTLREAEDLLHDLGYVDIEVREVHLRHELHHVEDTVRAILSLSLYQREFEQLPWAAREDLIRLLLARGEELVQRHGKAAFSFLNAAAFLRARRSPDDELPARQGRVLSLERMRRERITRETNA